LFGLLKRQHVLDAFAGEARSHQSGGAGGAEDFAMCRRMIGMRMRYERSRYGKMRIEPPIDLGEVNSVIKLNRPGHASVETAKDSGANGTQVGGPQGSKWKVVPPPERQAFAPAGSEIEI
jgi:hypothetical protein